VYISDGEYDSGHYDLVVRLSEEVVENEIYYKVWRQERVLDMVSDTTRHSRYNEANYGEFYARKLVYAYAEIACPLDV
jgi:hypothetical protein